MASTAPTSTATATAASASPPPPPSPQTATLKPAWLYFSGDFAPPHLGHVQTMETAIEYVNAITAGGATKQRVYKVERACFSPCHPGHLALKLAPSGESVALRHRLAMLRLLCEKLRPEHRSIVGKHLWETMQEEEPELGDVLSAWCAEGAEREGGPATVFWVAGPEGLGVPLQHMSEAGLHLMCVAGQPGFESTLKALQQVMAQASLPNQVHTITASKFLGFTSSAVRTALRAGGGSPHADALAALPPNVLKYIQLHKLWRPRLSQPHLHCHGLAPTALPRSLEDLTPASLTELFKAGCPAVFPPTTVVTSFVVQQLSSNSSGTTRARLHSIKYSSDSTHLPTSVAVHVDAPLAVQQQCHHSSSSRQVGFYNAFGAASCKLVGAPRCYFAAMLGKDGGGGGGITVLHDDDINSTTPGTSKWQTASLLSAEQAAQLVVALAELHANWWEHPEVVDATWLPNIVQAQAARATTAAERAKALREPLATRLSKTAARYTSITMFRDAYPRALRALAASPQTVVHGALDASATLWPAGASSTKKGGTATRVVDWGSAFKGCGVWDVATLLHTAVDTAVRREHQGEMVRLYHACLLRAGVEEESYDLRQCLADYAAASVAVVALRLDSVADDVLAGAGGGAGSGAGGASDDSSTWMRLLHSLEDVAVLAPKVR